MTRVFVFVLVGLTVLLAFSLCRDFGSDAASDWTQADRENAAHFFRSGEADIAATRITNKGPAFSVLSESDRLEILAKHKVALEEARLVTDPILERIAPGMTKPYREVYQRSLALSIENLEGTGSAQSAIEAGLLHDEWVDWYNENVKEVRIPRP